jgi:putative mycofactocin binding protein MftB
VAVSNGGAFDAAQAWKVSPQVAIRPERFGALAYHYGNRRLTFLKSPTLVALVEQLGDFATAVDAIAAVCPAGQAATYERALARLADSEVLVAR